MNDEIKTFIKEHLKIKIKNIPDYEGNNISISLLLDDEIVSGDSFYIEDGSIDHWEL